MPVKHQNAGDDAGDRSRHAAAADILLDGLPRGAPDRASQQRFLSVALPLLEEGFDVEFHVTGLSMRPFLQDGDLVRATPAGRRLPGRGEVVVAVVDGHGVMVHRVVRRKECEGGETLIELSGDGMLGHDLQVPARCVRARVTDVIRHGRSVGTQPGRARIWRSLRGLRHAVERLLAMADRRFKSPRRSD